MKFDIYGRFQLEVLREKEAWVVYRLAPGSRERDTDVVIPPSVEPDEMAAYLDDQFHELARSGETVVLLS